VTHTWHFNTGNGNWVNPYRTSLLQVLAITVSWYITHKLTSQQCSTIYWGTKRICNVRNRSYICCLCYSSESLQPHYMRERRSPTLLQVQLTESHKALIWLHCKISLFISFPSPSLTHSLSLILTHALAQTLSHGCTHIQSYSLSLMRAHTPARAHNPMCTHFH
jgi:hypothetical protein